MIERLSSHLAVALKASIPDHPHSVAKLKFGIHIILNTVLTIGAAILLGLLTGRLTDTLVSLFAFAVLRAVSGGYHLSSALMCVIVSSSVAAILPFIHISNAYIFVLNLTNLIVVFLYAPSRITGQTRIPKRYYPLLKVLSLFIVASNLWFSSPLLTLTWFVQSASLIRLKGGESV